MYAIKGFYKNGKIELLEKPPLRRNTRVLVIFPETEQNNKDILDEKLFFTGSKDMDTILKNEPDWKPSKFLNRSE